MFLCLLYTGIINILLLSKVTSLNSCYRYWTNLSPNMSSRSAFIKSSSLYPISFKNSNEHRIILFSSKTKKLFSTYDYPFYISKNVSSFDFKLYSDTKEWPFRRCSISTIIVFSLPIFLYSLNLSNLDRN